MSVLRRMNARWFPQMDADFIRRPSWIDLRASAVFNQRESAGEIFLRSAIAFKTHLPETLYFYEMAFPFPYQFFPLGDAALVLMLENRMDIDLNTAIVSLFNRLQEKMQDVVQDMVPAYSSLTVYYHPRKARELAPAGTSLFGYICQRIEVCMTGVQEKPSPSSTIKIPVCYEQAYAPDLAALAEEKRMSIAEVIALHTATVYSVYMIGFLPGFAYLGAVHQRINMPRKPVPQTVAAGSIGIAGAQTGIYPLDSPGGWHIIGRTPFRMFDGDKYPPTTLQSGNKVQFYPIDSHEFKSY